MYERGGHSPMNYPYLEHAGDGHPFSSLLIFLLFALVVGVIAALLFRWAANRRAGTLRLAPATGGLTEDALRVVRMRYARGEIDREQFLQTTDDLGESRAYPVAEHSPDAPIA
jgi:uncharacterized membrane protein